MTRPKRPLSRINTQFMIPLTILAFWTLALFATLVLVVQMTSQAVQAQGHEKKESKESKKIKISTEETCSRDRGTSTVTGVHDILLEFNDLHLSSSSSPCNETIQLEITDIAYAKLGYHEFPTDTSIAQVKEKIKAILAEKAGVSEFFPDKELHVFQGLRGCVPLKDDLTLKQAGFKNLQNLKFKVYAKKVEETPERIYDQDVLPVLKDHLNDIETISDIDESEIVMIGIASHIKSSDENQQFPQELREKVKNNKKGITIMLIDGSFKEKFSDFGQIYTSGAFGAKNWKYVNSQANGKVRTYVNEKDFGAKVTVRVYATNILGREWTEPDAFNPTLAGTISLRDLGLRLESRGKSFLVGDFHVMSSRPNIWGHF